MELTKSEQGKKNKRMGRPKGGTPWNKGMKGKYRLWDKVPNPMKGRIGSFKGKTHTEESKKKMRKSSKGQIGLKGKNNGNWKGDNALYNSIHGWINNNFNKPENCESCNKKRKLEWSNKNHKYLRNKEDWRCICRSCHRRYDNDNN